MADSPNEPSFEAAFTQLQETVERLEAGNLSLADATRLYEEGMRLAQTCNQLLSGAEQRIVQLHNVFAEAQCPAEEADADAAAHDDEDEPYGDEEEPGASRPS